MCTGDGIVVLVEIGMVNGPGKGPQLQALLWHVYRVAFRRTRRSYYRR